MTQEGPSQRALHNHVFQVKPKRVRDHTDCPACSSIDLDHMDTWYAAGWHYRLKAEADIERDLRQ